ncbi:MAG: protein kinase [Phycisphaerales bacterium]
MKQQLGDFELQEQIDPGGYTTVYKAVQWMRHGMSRPAAIKLLQGWATDTAEQVDALRHEVSVLAEVGNAPNIVTVYDFDIDEEVGPWIAMELLGENLRHYISNDPSDPELVRSMLYDALRALSVLHNAKTPIIHRDIKPNNILSTEYGIWKLVDFGVARRVYSDDDTVNVMTVQYASPEMLDGTFGEVSPASDLYALGITAYHYALGDEMYRAQFPSIYDPQSGVDPSETKTDDRAKWMYWHTSTQMNLRPLAEIIEGYPSDLSETIARMTAKPIADRTATSEEALSLLNMHSGATKQLEVTARMAKKAEEGDEKKGGGAIIGLALGAVAAIVFLMLVAYVMLSLGATPSIRLQEATFVGQTPDVAVRGTIENFPRGAQAIVTDGRRTYPASVDSAGDFTANVRMARLGQSDVELIVSRGDTPILKKKFIVERVAPEIVEVRARVRPAVEGASVVFKEVESGQTFRVPTNPAGLATTALNYGDFVVEASHPRFLPYASDANTGFDPVKEVVIDLTPMNPAQVNAKRQELMDELQDVAARAAEGDPEAIKRLAEIQAELALLEEDPNSTEARARAALVAEFVDVAQHAASGDPEAQRRLREINREINELNNQSASTSARRASIEREMSTLRARAAAGDPEAQRRLRQLQRESESLDRQDRRASIEREMDSLREAAANGDPEAQRRLAALQGELAQLDRADRKRAIQDEMDSLRARAEAGDPEAQRRLSQLQSELDGLDRADRRASIQNEMENLRALAASGDPEAQRRMRELEREMAGIDRQDRTAPSGAAARRNELVREMGDLAARVAAGDPAAIARMREIQQELASLEASDPSSGRTAIGARRQELIAEMASLTERAAAGDPAAIARLQQIQQELATLGAIESATSGQAGLAAAAADMMGGTPTLDLIDRATLLALPPDQFRAFVEVNIPTGALTVETIPHLSRLRLRGAVFSDAEHDLLLARLEPAMSRLLLEVTVDPRTVSRRLTDALQLSGGESVVVHPYLTNEEKTIFVKFSPSYEFTEARARTIAHRFVIDSNLLVVQPF